MFKEICIAVVVIDLIVILATRMVTHPRFQKFLKSVRSRRNK